MRTFLYNTITNQRVGDIREGRYLVDGQPAILPPEIVELEMITLPEPSYDTNTHSREEREYADLDNKQWVKEYYLRALSPQEIEQRNAPSSPNVCTPRQMRIALIKSGISIASIESQIEAIADPVQKEIAKVEWQYALEIRKDHPLVGMLASNLNLTTQQVNDIFTLAVRS